MLNLVITIVVDREIEGKGECTLRAKDCTLKDILAICGVKETLNEMIKGRVIVKQLGK